MSAPTVAGSIRGATQVAVVIGDPIEHSQSPAIQNAAFVATGIDAVMVPLRVRAADVRSVIESLRSAGVLGVSVTTPHKQAVMAACTVLAPSARRTGAVNCLAVGVDGGWIGHNTDGLGFVTALGDGGVVLGGARAVVLGAGGAARAITTALAAAGASTIVVARRPEQAAWLDDVIDDPIARAVRPWDLATLRAVFADATLLVDTTPIGLEPANEVSVVDALPLDALPAHAAVASLIYHRTPRLLTAASARGLAVIDGRGMLIHQGASAFQLWTGVAAPVAAMAAAFDDARSTRPR